MPKENQITGEDIIEKLIVVLNKKFRGQDVSIVFASSSYEEDESQRVYTKLNGVVSKFVKCDERQKCVSIETYYDDKEVSKENLIYSRIEYGIAVLFENDTEYQKVLEISELEELEEDINWKENDGSVEVYDNYYQYPAVKTLSVKIGHFSV